MKATKSKIATPSSLHLQQQANNEPFFKKGGDAMSDAEKSNDPQPFFVKPPVQTKLTIGKPNDKYEVEADHVADQVVQKLAQANTAAQSPNPPNLQTQEEDEIQEKPQLDIQAKAIFESNEDAPPVQIKPLNAPVLQTQTAENAPEEELQQKEEEVSENELDIEKQPIFEGNTEPPPEENNTVQTKSDSEGNTASPDLESRLSSSKGGGQALPAATQDSMGTAMGADFSGVRVHTGSEAVQMNQDLGAQAFTHGSDIYFNKGKYDTGSTGGQHLLAHELTHTVQQGAASENIQQKSDKPLPIEAPTTALDITHRFLPKGAWKTYLDSQKKGKKTDVLVKIGNDYEGVIIVRRIKEPTETQPGEYQVYEKEYKRFLEAKGLTSLNFLRQANIIPGLVLNKFGQNRETTGFISVKAKGVQVGNVGSMLTAFNKNMEALGFLGLDKFSLKEIQIENKFEGGRLLFSVGGLKTIVSGFLEAGAGIGITGNQFTMDVNANVNVRGVAQGEFNLKRLPTGKLEGRSEINADIANVEATLIVEYLDGVVAIQGTGKINSEKFSGSVSFLVTDEKRANETMRTELGVVQVEGDAKQPKKTKERPKTQKNQVLVGWGDVTAKVTSWLEGTAKIGIDSKGQVTMVGKLVVPNEVELMKEEGVQKTIFDVKIKGGFGVPFVGQAYLFAGVELFMNAGFGPLVLKGVELTGVYSTDPKILQNFSITGTLNINAFAILGLKAKAGVGLSLLGHDIEAGISVTAAAGLRAYAEATPVFEYVERTSPEGGKVGEAWLKGHFEAAAQLFLMLAGEFYIELDSPWWSPAPDKKWPYPLGAVEYPIGDSMGVGADIEWLVGSPEVPQLEFTPVEFNPEKFTKDVMADPPPGKGNGGEKKNQGKWEDGSKKGDLDKDPKANPNGKGLETKKKIDYTKLPDQERYMKGLAEVGDLAERAKTSPITTSVINAKIKKIKAKYALGTVKIKDKEDGAAFVYVKHKNQNNSKNQIKVRLMSEAERILLAKKAGEEFQQMLKAKAGDSNAISESDAQAVAQTIQRKHAIVLESLTVVDGDDVWEFSADFGDNIKKWPGIKKLETTKKQEDVVELGDTEVGEIMHFNIGGEKHKIWVKVTGMKAVLMVASEEGTVLAKLSEWKEKLNNIGEKQKKAENLIARARKEFEIAEKEANEAAKEINEAQTEPTTKNIEEAKKADAETVTAEAKLKETMKNLFGIFGGEKTTNLINRFDNELKKVHPKVYTKILSEFEKNPDKYNNIADWSAIRKTLEINALSEEHKRPLSKRHEYGIFIVEHQAMAALNTAIKKSKKPEKKILDGVKKKDYILRRQGAVTGAKEKTPVQVLTSLQNQVFNKNIDTEVSNILIQFFENSTKGKSEHNKFYPVDIVSSQSSIGEKLTYKYAEGKQTFTVHLNDNKFPQVIIGDKLKLHSLGRGTTQSNKNKPKSRGLDSAHLIANMFGGSGYLKAKNLIITSAEYNQKIMSSKEKEILNYIESIDNVDYFKMMVKVEYQKPNEKIYFSEIKKEILNETKDDDERRFVNSNDDLRQRVENTLRKIIQPRVSQVFYTLSLHNENNTLIDKKGFRIEKADLFLGTKTTK